MISLLLIIIGAVFVFFGIWMIFGMAIQPLKKIFGVVFKRIDDYIQYDTKKGKELLEREEKKVTVLAVTLIVIGVMMIATGLFLRYSNRGNDSLFSDNVPGVTQGDDLETSLFWKNTTEDGHYLSPTGKEYEYYISIEGTTINFSGQKFDNVTDFGDYMTNIDRNCCIYLHDEYASSKTYHDVMNILDTYKMTYEKDN